MNGIKERIREVLRYLGMNQSQLSDGLGFHKTYLNGILTKDNKLPSDEFYEKLEIRFGISQEWMRYGRGRMVKENWEGLSTEELLSMVMLSTLPEEHKRAIMTIIRVAAENQELLEERIAKGESRTTKTREALDKILETVAKSKEERK